MKFTLLLTLFCFSALGEFHQICGKYFIEDLKFTQNEKIFICGSEASGWKDVPENQAKFHLTGFLNARGYFKFRFEEKNKNIYIEKGEISRIEKIYFHGGPSGFFDTQYIGMYGKTLTEDHLGEISGWTEARLASIGFPCAKVQTHASYATGDVLVYIEPNEKIFIQELKREKTPKLKAVALERYDAINEGDLYNRDFFGPDE